MRIVVLKELAYAPGQGSVTNTYAPGTVIEVTESAGQYFCDEELAEETSLPLSGQAEQPEETEPEGQQPGGGQEPEVKASDKAIAVASELGVDLNTVTGTGKDGTITVADVKRSAEG